MDEKSWNINGILADLAIRSWRGKEKPHMYVWFLFEAVASGPRVKLLENHKLKRLFDALECQDPTRNLLSARPPAVLITGATGFHDIFCHLEKRREEAKVRVWSWQVIIYSLGPKDGFPISAIGVPCLVFLVFLFGYDKGQDAQSSFRNFFTSKAKTMKSTYVAEEMEDIDSFFMRRGIPWLKITIALTILSDHMVDDMVIVNVNGGPKFTYLGLVRF